MVAVALGVFRLVVARAILGLARGAPVPIDHGSHAAPRELRDMAGLAGNLADVVVELDLRDRLLRVRRRSVTGLARRHVPTLTGQACALFVLGLHFIAAAGPNVVLGDVTRSAGEVQAVGRHMHVDRFGWCSQCGGKIAVLDVVTTAAIEVARAAILPLWQDHVLRHGCPVNRLFAFEHDRAGFTAARVGGFVIAAGAVMADHTVDVFLIGEIKGFVFPTVARMALRAHAFIATCVGAEIID
ncbi:MAG: hypothetical protein BWZ07_02649 [Alphaproteobacteria bacterium ADurb.BinA280]|nr:MAG: hypothetical protein BWZ07_02649 [Alphaproteobacteria bacterium ADurb.BinA280]